MDLVLLEEALLGRGEPAFRARQVWEWTARGASTFEEMTTLPKSLRAELAESVAFSTLEVVHELRARDGTVKTLFSTTDGHPVEAVLMRYRDGRRSVCLSSQSGCPLTCTFCATGSMRFGRNLTASEILDQALHFRRFLDRDAGSGLRGDARESRRRAAQTKPPGTASVRPSGERAGSARERPAAGGLTHVVYMGMGEPFLNLDAVLESALRLPDLGVTHRRTTVSTVGWLPGLRRFVDEVDRPIRLALSLHAADPAKRSALMPVNDRYPLADVVEECRRYVALRGRKVFVEYVMLAGVNDSPADARALASLLDARSFKVNLIPYNPTPAQARHLRAQMPSAPRTVGGRFEGSSRIAIDRFKAVLDRARIPATVRLTRGRDIDAACGQLAASRRILQSSATAASSR